MLSRTASSLIRRQCQAAGVRSFANVRFVAHVASSFAVPNQNQQQQLMLSTRRSFSDKTDDTHDDFAPQKKEVSEVPDEAVAMIEQQVNDNPIMLYMKGNPSMPMCGFSAKIVQTLQAEGVDFSSVNVLDYPSIREGVKKFAAWPTM
jgi:monothiol glutaredoxin